MPKKTGYKTTKKKRKVSKAKIKTTIKNSKGAKVRVWNIKA